MAAAQKEDRLEGLKAFDETLFKHMKLPGQDPVAHHRPKLEPEPVQFVSGVRPHGEVLQARQAAERRLGARQRSRHGDARRQPETHGDAVCPAGRCAERALSALRHSQEMARRRTAQRRPAAGALVGADLPASCRETALKGILDQLPDQAGWLAPQAFRAALRLALRRTPRTS